MATIDPSIAMGYKPIQIENPLNQLAAVSQIQSGQQGQQLNALKIKEAERELTENEGIRNYLASADLNTPEGRGGLRQFGKTGLTYEKLLADQEKAGLERTKLKGEISEQDRVESRENFKNLVFNTSDENVLAHLQDSIKKGKITPEAAQQQWASVSGMTPEQRKQHFTMLSLKAEKYFELNKPQVFQENLGGVNRVSTIPGMGGAPTVVSEAKRTPTPGELLVNQREQQRINLGERRDIVANTTTDAAGNITQFNKFGEVVGKVNAAGKPSATFEKAANVKSELQKNLGTTITELKDAIKPGGLLEESTASGAGKVLDAAGNFVGYATKGSIAAASLAPIADMALKMVPRFEGPQSDKDTASYKEAAGQLANSALPVATRKAAAKTIIRIMENRKNQFTTEGMINEGISSGGPALPPGFTVDK
jgi:inosine/xanthosine triphosphate pyrophosphatase family protein